MLASILSAGNTGRMLTHVGVICWSTAEIVGKTRRPMSRVPADVGGKGIRDIEKAVRLEGLWEHADVLEAKDGDTLRQDVRDIVEEVVLADV